MAKKFNYAARKNEMKILAQRLKKGRNPFQEKYDDLENKLGIMIHAVNHADAIYEVKLSDAQARRYRMYLFNYFQQLCRWLEIPNVYLKDAFPRTKKQIVNK